MKLSEPPPKAVAVANTGTKLKFKKQIINSSPSELGASLRSGGRKKLTDKITSMPTGNAVAVNSPHSAASLPLAAADTGNIQVQIGAIESDSDSGNIIASALPDLTAPSSTAVPSPATAAAVGPAESNEFVDIVPFHAAALFSQ